ncbi:basement membrane-specific heparan sulfate proteoglycan core protein-like [Notothenia coriiceps]|uniref:Basement membrane-specific heparan sulfate proteoglycan core protein-like n=1 Tax=Notothenia coriiceps TaxID=8208 RepID=A0A6I9P280_9TELE|nr:PREDICTED: basement membrane-specific heparan sulfate proteoglycan core protein-like [Notothenia coriiceps]
MYLLYPPSDADCSRYYRDLVSTVFTPGNFQGFALVNRQRTNRISSGFTVEVSTEGTQLSYTSFDYLGQEPHYWQLPDAYQGDKKESSSARGKRAEQVQSVLMHFSVCLELFAC